MREQRIEGTDENMLWMNRRSAFANKPFKETSLWDQSLIKVVSYSASYLCKCVCVHMPECTLSSGSLTVRLMSPPNAGIKCESCATINVSECALARLDARGSHKSCMSDKGVNSCWLGTLFVFTLLGTQARHKIGIKCIRVVLFCGKYRNKSQDIWDNQNTCHQTTSSIQPYWLICDKPVLFA